MARGISHNGRSDDRPRVIIKKVKSKHGGHHGGAWKVAYADFVTAMMALFIVLWIIASSTPELKAGLAQYFRDPGVFEKSSQGLIPQNNNGEGLASGSEKSPETLEGLQGQLRAELQSLKEYPTIQDQISIRLTPDGLLIEIVDKDNNAFFDLSSAKLKPIMIRVLEVIVQQVGKYPNGIAISGHTDARPYQNESFYSNWDLSAARALNTRRAMEEMGLPSARVERVVGYADRSLLFPDNPLSPANRRIAILVFQS